MSFPFLTLCAYPFHQQSKLLKECSTPNFTSSLKNCYDTNPEFSFDKLHDSFIFNVTDTIKLTKFEYSTRVNLNELNEEFWSTIYHPFLGKDKTIPIDKSHNVAF